MAFYKALKKYNLEDSNWIAKRLLSLRKCLDRDITSERDPDSLIIGSWNIRAFDGGKPRRDESYHYIAEIIDRFDMCAIQEIKKDLMPLKKLVSYLGPNWDYFVTDITLGLQGNTERQAFLYNKNKVFFRNVIGELVLPPNDLIEGEQIARTPFFASFQSNWFKFTICSSHITFAENRLRALEIDAIAKIISKRAVKENEIYVFLGDMNIDTIDDDTFKALSTNNLNVPLFGDTNLAGGKSFDQITFTNKPRKTELLRFGKFNWREAVYKENEIDLYKQIAEKSRGKPYKSWNPKSYRKWTTNEMSDHLPIWVEIKTDYSNDYLKRFLK